MRREMTMASGWRPKPEQADRLLQLAAWLENHAGDLLARNLNPDTHPDDQPFTMGAYAGADYDELCGSSGCAIGWASNAIEPRQRVETTAGSWYLETWWEFAQRLFGTDDKEMPSGAFMFSANWANDPAQDEAKATAERIRFVVQHDGAVPVEWGAIWRDGQWTHEW